MLFNVIFTIVCIFFYFQFLWIDDCSIRHTFFQSEMFSGKCKLQTNEMDENLSRQHSLLYKNQKKTLHAHSTPDL